LLGRAARAAHTLLDGARSLSGRRVAILAPPGIDFLVALFGAWRAGATVVVLSPLHPRAESEFFCDHAAVDTLVVDPTLAELARPLVADRRRLIALPTLDAQRTLGDPPEASLADDALVLYTSGTTARPKGARITHDNLAVHARLLREAWRWTTSDRLLHALPLHHLHGLGIALLTALSAGACAELFVRFDAARIWDAMGASRHGTPVLMAVPTMYTRLLGAFDSAEPALRQRWATGATSLRLATSGSAALAPALSDRFLAVSGVRPLERFGMTEIGVGTAARIDGPRTPGVAGHALPTVELRVVDDEGKPLPACSQGELQVRGPSVFPGYDGDEEATRASFTEGDPSDGWFRTGDSVTLDDEGALHVAGRLSVDVLKSGGYKISALEIEAALREHRSIEDAAVVGLPDPEWGDLVTAVLVLRAGEALDDASLRDFLRDRLAPYKIPKRFVRMSALPRNVVGKVVKPELIRSVREGRGLLP
jgi:malonyl-CoA/methylmalonyl-CoA synthetase